MSAAMAARVKRLEERITKLEEQIMIMDLDKIKEPAPKRGPGRPRKTEIDKMVEAEALHRG